MGFHSAVHLDIMITDEQYLVEQGCLRHRSAALRIRQQYTSPESGHCSSDAGCEGTRTETKQVRGRCSLIY